MTAKGRKKKFDEPSPHQPTRKTNSDRICGGIGIGLELVHKGSFLWFDLEGAQQQRLSLINHQQCPCLAGKSGNGFIYPRGLTFSAQGIQGLADSSKDIRLIIRLTSPAITITGSHCHKS
jgi:hypothetical protein